jgi:hypothetical protein
MDSKEVLATIVGGATHAYLLSNPGDKSTMDNFITGAAGGALGGLLLTSYLPYSGNVAAVVSGVLGMIAFDYFLFQM